MFLVVWLVGLVLCVAGWFGTNRDTAILYSIVPILNIIGSFFLIGPCRQADKFLDANVRIPFIIFLTLIPLILFFGLAVANGIAIILMFFE